jgi:hypothetical protein
VAKTSKISAEKWQESTILPEKLKFKHYGNRIVD